MPSCSSGLDALFQKFICKAFLLLCLHYKLPEECSVSSWGSFGGQFWFYNLEWLNLRQDPDGGRISAFLPTPELIFCALFVR